MTLIDKLTNIYEIHNSGAATGWYEYLVETPKFRFHHFIYESVIGENLVLVSIRDEFNGSFATEFIEYLASCDRSFLVCDSIRKDSILSFAETKMNASVFLGPRYHTSFKAEAPDVHIKTTVCFPIYNCEFKGDEPSNEIMLLRRDFVSTVNWNRDPSPKIRFRFDNPKTKAGTIGKKFGLIKLDVVENEIKNLSGVEDGFMDIFNFNDFYIKICSPNKNYYVIYNKSDESIFSGDIRLSLNVIKRFLIDGDMIS